MHGGRGSRRVLAQGRGAEKSGGLRGTGRGLGMLWPTLPLGARQAAVPWLSLLSCFGALSGIFAINI